jgi:hypothetical protein
MKKMMRNKTPRFRLLRTDGKGVSGEETPQISTIPRPIRGEKIAEMITARELEAFFKIDVETIYMHVQKGLIPYVRIQSDLRFIRREILDWIDQLSFRHQPADRERP